MSRNLTSLSGRKGLSNNLFERLCELSEIEGAPTEESLKALADKFLMGPANLYGAASFYDLTRPGNRGIKVYACNGSACQLAGTQPGLKAKLSAYFKEEEVGEMCCLGRCHENAAFQYQGLNYSGPDADALQAILEGRHPAGSGKYEVHAHGRALLTRDFPSLESCCQTLAEMLARGPQAALAEVEASGLQGRGGAGFPISVKMKHCAQAPGSPKFVVCNADEGDPGAYSDRYLLEQQPYAVLLGMLIAGYAIGAHEGVLYIRAEYPESMERMSQAIMELEHRGLAGEDVLDSGFAFHFKLLKARGAYICGEETALLASIEGQRPEVRVRPPYPALEGLFGKPTLVNNVETLANLYYILRDGGAAFRAIGTRNNTGTKLLSLDSAFMRPGVYEVEMGTALDVVVDELGGGFSHPVKALHIGGPLGGVVPLGMIPELAVDFESFSRHGFLLGHASVIGIPKDYPMIVYLEHLFEFAAHESCGKCFPCRLGTVRGQELLHKARAGGYVIDGDLFESLLDTLERGSLCGLGGGIPLPVRNALQYFRDELEPYFSKLQSAGHE